MAIPVALDKTLGALLAMAGARQQHGHFDLHQTLGGESFIATAFAQDDAEAARLQWRNRGTTDDHKINKGPSKRPAKYAIGVSITGAKDLPDELVSKLIKLKGLRVAFDPRNGSALPIAADDRIVAIVEQA